MSVLFEQSIIRVVLIAQLVEVTDSARQCCRGSPAVGKYFSAFSSIVDFYISPYISYIYIYGEIIINSAYKTKCMYAHGML